MVEGGNSSNSRYFTCGTLDRSLKFAKSRFTHKIIIIILNRFFLVENVKANMKSRVQCEKQTLVRVQSRKNVKLVPGTRKTCPGTRKTCPWDTFFKNVPKFTNDVRKRLETLKNNVEC